MCKNYEKWVFTLPSDFTWKSDVAIAEDVSFKDKTGAVRLILRRPDEITVTARYAWDGCSPKLCVWDLLLGTPDGVVDSATKQPKTYYASLVHDALYQFLLRRSAAQTLAGRPLLFPADERNTLRAALLVLGRGARARMGVRGAAPL
jgi:hypothetical protein